MTIYITELIAGLSLLMVLTVYIIKYILYANKKLIDHDELLSTLSYDSETGIFKWLKTNSVVRVKGSIAGGVSGGYICISINNVLYYAHRLAWFYVYKNGLLSLLIM